MLVEVDILDVEIDDVMPKSLTADFGVFVEYKKLGLYSGFKSYSFLILVLSDDIAVLSGSEYRPGWCFCSTMSTEVAGKDEEDDMSLTYVIGITGDNGISLMGFVYCTTSVWMYDEGDEDATDVSVGGSNILKPSMVPELDVVIGGNRWWGIGWGGRVTNCVLGSCVKLFIDTNAGVYDGKDGMYVGSPCVEEVDVSIIPSLDGSGASSWWNTSGGAAGRYSSDESEWSVIPNPSWVAVKLVIQEIFDKPSDIEGKAVIVVYKGCWPFERTNAFEVPGWTVKDIICLSKSTLYFG